MSTTSNSTGCDPSQTRDNLAGTIVFSLYAVSHILLLCCTTRVLRKTKRFFLAYWLAVPLAFFLIYETISIAAYENNGNDLRDSANVVRYIMQSFIVPLFLVTMFELVYMVHKPRSVNFCGIKFDEGHRNDNEQCSHFMRLSMWFISVGVLVFALTANIITAAMALDEEDSSRFCNKSLLDSFASGTTLSALADIIPTIVLIVFSLYFGALLWRYGTHYAFKVYATLFNPWLVTFLGAVWLCVAFFLPSGAEYAVDAGYLCLHASCVWTVTETLNEVERGEMVKSYLRKTRKKSIAYRGTDAESSSVDSRGMSPRHLAPRESMADDDDKLVCV